MRKTTTINIDDYNLTMIDIRIAELDEQLAEAYISLYFMHACLYLKLHKLAKVKMTMTKIHAEISSLSYHIDDLLAKKAKLMAAKH